MKKFLVLAAAAAFALVACNKDNPTIDGSGSGNGGNKPSAELVLNELDGQNKFIEIYNKSDKEASLEGVYFVKYDSEKPDGKTTTWVGAAGMKIPAKGFVYIESFDLCDEDENGERDNDYVFQSDNHIFKGGLSPKKNMKIELYDAEDKLLDTYTRGEEGKGWNQVKGFYEDDDHSYSRVPDGTGEFAYALPTPGAKNGAFVKEIPQQPEQ